jgi:outer membrane protein assembly factor BamB
MRAVLILVTALTLSAADWPQLRGPNGSGLCENCGQIPTEFGPQKNLVWKTDVPVGNSSPVLVGERIILTAAEGDDLITMSLDRATGKVQWRQSVRAARKEFQHTLNHRAAPTAVTDGKAVYVFFADFGLVAYDLTGKQRWQLPLGPFNSLHGIAASPVYIDGRVLLVADSDTEAVVVRARAHLPAEVGTDYFRRHALLQWLDRGQRCRPAGGTARLRRGGGQGRRQS